MVQNSELSAGKVPVVATFIVKNQHASEFEGAATKLIPPTREEPGCLYYSLTKATDQPDPEHTKYMFVEIYTSEEALQTHLARSDIQEAITMCGAWLKEGTSPQIEALTLVM